MAATSWPPHSVRFAIDRGGTFTDVVATLPDGGTRVLKLLSVDPAYADAPREGIRRLLETVTGVPHPRDEPVRTHFIHSVRMGTTVATNALLERKGDRCALVITAGFRDLLHIGNQARPRIFALDITVPDVLYERVVEVDERVVLARDDSAVDGNGPVHQGTTGEAVRVERPVDTDSVRAQLAALLADGIRNVAIVLMHAYTFADHERAVAAIARELGFANVTCSHDVMPMVKIVPRGFTTTADAYLTPGIRQYVAGFCAGFDAGLGKDVPVLFMQSDGGLTPMDAFTGFRAILSGPAGGVVGYAQTSYTALLGHGERVTGPGARRPCRLGGPCHAHHMRRPAAHIYDRATRGGGAVSSARHRVRHGRDLDRRVPVRRPVRPRLRDDDGRRNHPSPATRHQHRCCRGRIVPWLPRWHVHRGTRVPQPGCDAGWPHDPRELTCTRLAAILRELP